MTSTWILVADQARARLFSPSADMKDLEEVGDYVNVDARLPDHQLQGSRRPPRVHERFGEVRHSIEPRTTPQDKSVARFASLLGSVLKRGHSERRFTRLVLIAPPRFLGALNKALDPRLDAVVVLKMPKNLTLETPHAIRGELPRSLLRRDSDIAARRA